MEVYLAYYGEFLDRQDEAWRVEIRREWIGEGNAPADTAAVELVFPGDSPLVLEWTAAEKHEPVQSSSATLKVISETDREFIGLYTTKAASVRLDVLVPELHGDKYEWVVFWSGTLDTELYEEPYSYGSGYEVELTFADFGVLSRLSYNLSGKKTFLEILEAGLTASGIRFRGDVWECISTSRNSKVIKLSEMSVLSDNFYDEEGVPMTFEEVFAAILQPLALRIIQREGYIRVYDLSWLYAQTPDAVEWFGTDACLSVDKVYNNVNVTYSPYDGSKAMAVEISTREDLSWTLDDNVLVRMNYSDQGNYAIDGFRMWYGPDLEGSSALELSSGAQYMRIDPINSGEEAAAVLWGMRRGDVGMKEAGEAGSGTQIVLVGSEPGFPDFIDSDGQLAQMGAPLSSGSVYKSPRLYLDTGGEDLRINLDLLFDVRYNPFEDASDGNEKGNYNEMREKCNFGCVPIILNFVAEDGTVIGHYENYKMMGSDGWGRRAELCHWVSGAGTAGKAWLMYYDPDNRKDSSGFGGWQTNRQSIGDYTGDLPRSLTIKEPGEYVDNPAYRFSRPGYLELTVLAGVFTFGGGTGREIVNIHPKVRWLAYKAPEITIVDQYGKEVESKDYEDQAHLDPDAREELNLNLICGSRGLPNAKGRMYYKGEVLQSAARGGVSDSPQRLLIGTIYSQYAVGCTVLSGTALPLRGLKPVSDTATPGNFIMRLEVYDVRAAESSIEIVELKEENYTAVEYV